jgi:alpha-galactosidase
MKAAADNIKSLGLVSGIWFMPFAGTVGDPFFDQHLDWFAQTADGKPYDTPWGGACLDMTHPGARAHVSDITRRICRDWGFEYIKIDGLWTGTATRQNYVNAGYKEDHIGESILHNLDKTHIEAYRDGLRLVREAAGKKVYILGCNGPQNMRSYGGAIGLVDGMRVGPDNGADWNRLTRGTIFGSRHYFMHNRVWHNDPDPVYVRDSMPLKHAQLICSWVALSGQLNLSSEWLPGLPAERLDILKRTMPQHQATARPVGQFFKHIF